jgi:hypothetical protein
MLHAAAISGATTADFDRWGTVGLTVDLDLGRHAERDRLAGRIDLDRDTGSRGEPDQ